MSATSADTDPLDMLLQLPDNLVDAWLVTQGSITLTQAAALLSERHCRNYTMRRVWDWSHGHRSLPRQVERELRRDLLIHIWGPRTGAALWARLEPRLDREGTT